MVRVGDRVRIRRTGETGKVLRIVREVKGVVLIPPIAVIRLVDPDPLGVTMTTAFEDELEAEEPDSEAVTA